MSPAPELCALPPLPPAPALCALPPLPPSARAPPSAPAPPPRPPCSNYGAYLLVDSEEEYYPAEVTKLEKDVRGHGLTLMVFAEW